MFRFFGGAQKLLVPDNLKRGVVKASFYDPEINRTYGAMAAYYLVGVLPARSYKPRDKAKVEVEAGVRFAQTYILGRLRAQTFFCPAECNEAIAEVHAAHKRAPDAPSGRKPGRTVRQDRTRHVDPAARRGLGVRGMGGAPGSISIITSRSTTFSTRFRMRSFAPRSRCASPRAASRCSVAANASRCTSAATWAASTARRLSTCRVPPTLRRVDAGSLPPLGRQDRAEYRGPDLRRSRQPAASRTGVPHLPGNLALLPRTRSRPGSKRPLGSSARTRRPQLQARRRAACPQGQRNRRRERAARPAVQSTPTCAAPATTIERIRPCSPIPRSTN